MTKDIVMNENSSFITMSFFIESGHEARKVFKHNFVGRHRYSRCRS